MAIDYHGTLTQINRLVVEQVIRRYPPGLWSESELTDVIFDSEQIDQDGGPYARGMFYPPGRIFFEDDLYQMPFAHYIVAHELSHEVDHSAAEHSFFRLGAMIPVPLLEGIFTQFYQAFSNANTTIKMIEGGATAWGMYYGTRPWALKKHFPQVWDIIHKQHGIWGGYPIDHPEYLLSERIYRYQPGTEPYFGELIRLSQLWGGTGWETVTLIRPAKTGVESWRFNEKMLDDILLNDPFDTQGRNPIIRTGDIIFRTVPEAWINEQNDTPAQRESQESGGY